MKSIRIGSGAGYAGDRLEPALELIEKGDLDYISFECLAERTIAIGQQNKLKDPTKGYNDLLEHRMEKALPLCWKHNVKLITNMGAANPEAAASKCMEIAKKHGLSGMKIACVTGDDLLPNIDKYMRSTVWETGEELSKLPGEIISANVYLGVDGILKALSQGADVVITGRVSDPAIFMAPIIHEFGWDLDDWDKLAKGTMIGHLLECGSQVAGGYYSEPGKKDVPGVGHIGFPIVEVQEDGSFIITKIPEAGGMISPSTCSEQITYEIHDASDTAFSAKLMEIRPDGSAYHVRSGIATLAYRSGADIPRGVYKAGQMVKVEINFWDIGWCFKTGTRLRLDISSSDFPQYSIHSNYPGVWSVQTKTKPAVQTVYSCPGNTSTIIFPIISNK